MHFMTEAGQEVPVEICRRKGTRHLRLGLGYQNQILVSAPWHVGERAVGKFIEKQRNWLESQLSQAPRVYSLSEWLSAYPQLTASGDVFALRIERSIRNKADYTFDSGGAVLVLRLPRIAEAPLRQLVRGLAKDALSCRVAYQAKRLGLNYGALSVRDQSSRWGSCSARRSISLNWRLLLLEPVLQDYIILHELAHLTEMNHSRRFWALLDSYDPQRVEHERALDRISAIYMRIARD
jgi:predicted metal-dependent hydrolase